MQKKRSIKEELEAGAVSLDVVAVIAVIAVIALALTFAVAVDVDVAVIAPLGKEGPPNKPLVSKAYC